MRSPRINRNELKPSRDLYVRIRAAFVAQDTTLGAWCRKNGIAQQHAGPCIMGVWNGPKGRELRARIIAAAGIAEVSIDCPKDDPGQRSGNDEPELDFNGRDS